MTAQVPVGWLLAALAVAGDDPDALARHQEAFRESRAAENDRRYADAVAACELAVAVAPSGPRAGTCRARLDWLAARRDADGTYTSLAELQAVRAAYRDLAPGEGAARVTALRARPGVPELVWVDAGIWLARDALDRGDHAAALAVIEPVVASHQGALRRPAVGVYALALVAAGRLEEALAAEQEIRVAPPGVRDTPVEQLLRARRERRVAWAAGGVVATFALVAGPLAWSGRRADGRPWGLVPIAAATAGAWAIGAGWEAGAGAAAPWMLVGFAAIHLVAGPAQRAADPRLRPALRVLAAAATIGVAVLALYGTDTLDWVAP